VGGLVELQQWKEIVVFSQNGGKRKKPTGEIVEKLDYRPTKGHRAEVRHREKGPSIVSKNEIGGGSD